MSDRRSDLANQNLVGTKLMIAASLKDRIHELKREYKMAAMDNVVSAMIRNAMTNYTVEELPVPPVAVGVQDTRRVTVHLAPEQRQFLKDVARHNRGITTGAALEAIAYRVHNLRPGASQMPLFDNTMKEGSAVSG